MPIDWLVLASAWLTGLLGGVHCMAMCGGIATGVGASTGRAHLGDALSVNLARVLGYTFAGVLVGGIGAAVLRVVQVPWLGTASRMLVGVVLIVAAIRLLWPRGKTGFLSRPGQQVWRWLQPLQQRLWPADTFAKRLALGVLWGWLPCGLSTTMLGAAWLQASALHGGLTMLAFGLGTLPLMVPLTWSGARAAAWLSRKPTRTLLGVLVLVAGIVTLAAPWLMHLPGMHGFLSALGCRSLPTP